MTHRHYVHQGGWKQFVSDVTHTAGLITKQTPPRKKGENRGEYVRRVMACNEMSMAVDANGALDSESHLSDTSIDTESGDDNEDGSVT